MPCDAPSPQFCNDLFLHDPRQHRLRRSARRVVVGQDSTAPNKIRVEVGDDKIVGLCFWSRLNAFHPAGARQRLQDGAVPEFFRHPPADAGNP